MIDITKEKTAMDCPKCQAKVMISIQDLANQITVQCKSCQESFQLIDEGGKAKKAVTDISKSMQDLEKAFRNLGR